MAVVGEAHIIVRALTTGVERDIQKGFSKLDGVAGRAGRKVGDSLGKGMSKGLQSPNNGLGRLSNQIKAMWPEAEKTAKTFTHLMRVGYGVQGAMGALGGSIGAIIGGLGSLIGVAGGAAASVVSLGSALMSAFAGAKIAGMALKGVGQAAAALRKGGGAGAGEDPAAQQKRIDDALKNLSRTIEDNQRKIVDANNKIRDAQIKLNQALKDGREEIQQLGFEAEDAALSESRAAIELEKARETLLRTQDLPPNSRARKEAEQAFKEADLNYRMAKDRASDLGKEQDRLARTGVEGTQVVKDARADLAAAEDDLAQTVVDAARAQADAELALAEALKKVENNAKGASDAMAGLTASQRVFAQYLANDILPKIDELRESIAGKFLPSLQTALDKVFKGGFFDKLKEGFTLIGEAAGTAINNFVDAVVEPKNAELLFNFLKQTADLLPVFGSIFGNVWGAALRLLDAASGMTQRFVGWLESKTGAFVDFLDAKKASGELDAFFANVEVVAGRVGGIFGNLFGGIGRIIQANIGPGTGGDMLLTWLEKVTDGFATADPVFLNNYFKGATANFIALLDAFSIVVDTIARAGAMPEVGEFWNIMSSGATAFDSLVREAVKVGPSLANLIKYLTEIAAAFADAGQAQAFLDTLAWIASGVAGVSKAIKPFMDFVGPFIGGFSAIALAAGLFGTGLVALMGFITPVLTAMGAIPIATTAASGGFLKLGASTLTTILGMMGIVPASAAAAAAETAAGVAATGAGTAMAIAFWPITLIIGAIALAVGGLIALFAIQEQESENAAKKITEGFKQGAGAADTMSKSLLALGDGPVKANLETITSTAGGLNASLEAANGNTKNLAIVAEETGARMSTSGLNEAMDAIGRSLGDLATTDLKGAQQAFKDFTEEQGLSHEAQLKALEMMPEYKKQLEEQAALYGVTTEKMTEAEKQEALLTFAKREGKVAMDDANKAMQTSIDKMAEGSKSAADLGKAFDTAMSDGKFSIDSYLKTLEGQFLARQQVAINRSILMSKGMSQDAIDILVAQGDKGFQTMAGLAQGTNEQVKKASDQLVMTSGEAGTAVTNASSQALDAIGKKYGSDTMGKVAQAMKETGGSVDQVMSVMGLKLDKFKPTVKVETESAKKAVEDLTGKINGVTGKDVSVNVGISAAGIQRLRDLGIIRKDGGIIPAFADGGGVWSKLGKVRGPGTSRSDSIPALLSAGEYVINAQATSRFLPLLDAINEGRIAASQLQSTMGNSPTVTTTGTAGGEPVIVNITVNPSAGMDESELASAISREITFQMRRGAVA